MATYYVDFVNGNDANNGLGPDASHASNKPWKTLTKLLGASGMASGDTAYLGPGGRFREAISVAMTSATVEAFIIGDPQNAQGFKTSGGVLVDPGPIIVTAYTTDDKTAPSASPTLNLNGKDHLTFQNIWFIGGGSAPGSTIKGTTSHSTDIKFQDCHFSSGSGFSTVSSIIEYAGLADTAGNWTFDRCVIDAQHVRRAVNIVLPTSASADYDANFQITNCVIAAPGLFCVAVDSSGAGSFKGGGVKILNCTLIGGGTDNAIRTLSASLSTSVPAITVNNSLVICSGTALQANTSGQITEDYNLIVATTARSNVTAGTHSISNGSYSPDYHLGQDRIFGMLHRPPFTPTVGSALLGFGDNGSAPSVDMQNRPRPAGGGSTSKAIGCQERHNTAVKETTTTDAGGVGLNITGPGDHDILIPVDAAATSISIRVRYDTNHGTGNKPQVQLLANGEIGVSAETKTATVGVDTWETLTFSSFTPTRKGWVTVRLVSRAAAGSGIAYFDTLTVA